MKIKRPSEKHFSDGLFTVKPFTGPEQQIRCGKTVSQRAFGVKADGYSAVCTAGRSREGQAARQGSGMNGLFGRGRLKIFFRRPRFIRRSRTDENHGRNPELQISACAGMTGNRFIRYIFEINQTFHFCGLIRTNRLCSISICLTVILRL